jgi:ABC-type multidrug transport system fused ATPase/permease subunit/predicted double-glycine peptidase
LDAKSKTYETRFRPRLVAFRPTERFALPPDARVSYGDVINKGHSAAAGMGFSARSSRRRNPRTPEIRQGEHAECGLAALAILLGHHGVHLTLADLRRRAGSTLLGSTLRQLREIAEGEGFTTSARRAEPCDLEALGLPLIAHMRFIHFAVVERISADTVYLNDPSIGPMTMTREAFSRDFTGIVLRLFPRDIRPQGRRFSLGRAMGAAFGAQALMGLAVLVLAATSGLLAATGFWTLCSSGDHATRAVGLLILSAVSLIGGVALAALIARDMAAIAHRRTLDRLGKAPNLYYLEARPERSLAVLAAVRSLQHYGVPHVALALAWMAALLGFAVWVAPWSGLLTTTFCLLQSAILLATALQRHGYAARFGRSAIPVQGVAAGYLAHSAWHRMGRGAHSLFSSLAGSHAQQAASTLKAAETYAVADSLVVMLDLCKLAVLVSLAARGVSSREDLLFGLTIAAISSVAIHFAAAYLGVRPLKDAMLRLSDPPPEASRSAPDPTSGTVDSARLSMDDAGWAPAGWSHPIVSGLSFSLRAGEVLAVHGTPGAGSTTLARLAAGLITPTAGQVRRGGSAILVDHQRFILPGTLRQNLTLGASGIDDQTVLRALETVEMNAVLAPRGGLDFVLKSDHPRLSGGQIRRLMISRALCRSPAILVLDGALDNVETSLARTILDNIRASGTAVVVTTKNRELLGFADQIFELGGRP